MDSEILTALKKIFEDALVEWADRERDKHRENEIMKMTTRSNFLRIATAIAYSLHYDFIADYEWLKEFEKRKKIVSQVLIDSDDGRRININYTSDKTSAESKLSEWLKEQRQNWGTVEDESIQSTVLTFLGLNWKEERRDYLFDEVWLKGYKRKYHRELSKEISKEKNTKNNSTRKNDSNNQSKAGPSRRPTPKLSRRSAPSRPSTSQQSDSVSERTTEDTDGHNSNVQFHTTTTSDKDYSNDQSQAGPSGTQTPTSTSNQSLTIQSSDSVCQQTTKNSIDPDSNNQLQPGGSGMEILEASTNNSTFIPSFCFGNVYNNIRSINGQPDDSVLRETTKNTGQPDFSSDSSESSDDEQSSRNSESENEQAIDQVEEGASVPEPAPKPENKQDVDQVAKGASVPEAAPDYELPEPRNKRSIDQVNEGESVPQAAPQHELPEPRNERSIDQVNEGESVPQAAPQHNIPDVAPRPAWPQYVSDYYYPGGAPINADRAAQEMASSDTVHVSSLPLPPVHYINLYTDENVRRNRAPRPPLPPVNDNYTMFRNIFNSEDPIIRPLESQGIKKLYPQHFDRKRELKKLNHSLLFNFLDLIDILMQCPESSKRAEKVDDLSLLFIHIHHLLNEFRPHQARETLRVMMEMQKRSREDTSKRFKKFLENVQEIVQKALQSLPDQSESDSQLMVNTEAMEVDNDENTDRTVDFCSPSDRIMCQEIDDMLLSSGVY